MIQDDGTAFQALAIAHGKLTICQVFCNEWWTVEIRYLPSFENIYINMRMHEHTLESAAMFCCGERYQLECHPCELAI